MGSCHLRVAAVSLCIAGLPALHAEDPATPSDPQGPTTPSVASPDQHKTVVVNALAYSTDTDGKGHGTCFPVRVTVGGPVNGPMRLGFFESEVGGSGPQWRASGWMAGLTAAQLTDYGPRTRQVSFDVQGRIDGPSAGALLTVGVLAAVRGDAVRDDAAMTGTINPDGMIGPVGGYLEKIEGAARAGKRLVLIPAGVGQARKVDQNQYVDVIEHGRNLKVEVRPVLDIYTAYEILTGARLPRAPAADPPRVSDEANRLVRPMLATWATRIQAAKAEYDKLPADAHNRLADGLIAKADRQVASAGRLSNEGEVSAAYSDMAAAAISAYTAMEIGRCWHIYKLKGQEAAVARIGDNSWLQQEVDRVGAAMRFFRPTTLDQLAMYFMACRSFFDAIGLQKRAQDTLRSLPADKGTANEAALNAALQQIMAWLDLQHANDYLELADRYGGKAIPPDAPLAQIAEYYRRAADANLEFFDTIIIEDIARESGVRAERVQAFLRVKDIHYGLLRTAMADVQPRLSTYFGTGPHLQYANLAASLHNHLYAAILVAKHYSLEAKLDRHFLVEAVGHERTLNEWLTASEDQARRSIALLARAGVDATTVAQIYEVSRIEGHRGLGGRLFALESLFSANVYAEVLRRLASVPLTSTRSRTR
jgi:predicted S18 family serine protease